MPQYKEKNKLNVNRIKIPLNSEDYYMSKSKIGILIMFNFYVPNNITLKYLQQNVNFRKKMREKMFKKFKPFISF